MIVKLRDHLGRSHDEAFTELAGPIRGLTIRPLFGSIPPDDLFALVARAMQQDPSYRPPDLLSYFAVGVPAGIDPEQVVRLLLSLSIVELAYVEPPPSPPPVVDGSNDPWCKHQGYLDPAPDGIDARYAWLYPGGDGAGQAIVDVEWGWKLDHDDLSALGITLISGINHPSRDHGTMVLGVIAAQDNKVGCVGITPNLKPINGVPPVRCAGQWCLGEDLPNTARPMLEAIAEMQFGDVLLLEAQTSYGIYRGIPVEIQPPVYEMVRLATALGIVVVEAAGNGDEIYGVDLDTVEDHTGQQVLNRASPGFRDSGAIVVAAGSAEAPHDRCEFSCFGSRIDCYAWGEGVVTTTPNPPKYTSGFNGTSSAAAIAAGAALALQGLAQAKLGHRFGPLTARAMLSDPATGTWSKNPPVDRIGVMPNLRAIIDSDTLNLAPHVYLRRFVGDEGGSLGGISSSPDVILQRDRLRNPQQQLGAASGTENDPSYGDEAEAGHDNFIYLRVSNRGGSAAVDVAATLYWAPVSTLLAPDLWTLVGSTRIAGIPTGNLPTIASAIVWSKAHIPASGHFSYIALIERSGEVPLTPSQFYDWTSFRHLLRANDRVASRSVNLVSNLPPQGGNGSVVLPFIAAGAPDKARPMQLEVVARLPSEARARLELTPELASLFCSRYMQVPDDTSRDVQLPLNPTGSTRFTETLFPVKARFPMRLLVDVPKDARGHSFEIHARQLYCGEEVGQVTWRLVPRRPGQERERSTGDGANVARMTSRAVVRSRPGVVGGE